MKQKEYISKYWPYAVFVNLFSDLFPSVVLAQGILESGNGNSGLTTKYKNHFGIKAHGKRGTLMKTFEFIDGNKKQVDSSFRVYKSSIGSYADHKAFLYENPRYKKNGVFSATTPEEQAGALKAAGYATAPDYKEKLIRLIENNNLKKFDKIRIMIKSAFVIITVAIILYFANKKGVISINKDLLLKWKK